MEALNKARTQINNIDKQMAMLFEERIQGGKGTAYP